MYGVKLFDFELPMGQREVPEELASIDPDATNARYYKYSDKTVAVFVLDVRTNKTPWKTGSAAYQEDLEGDFLGERQWRWFEQAIQNSRASVNVIVNGLQVYANRYPNGNVAEAWSRYPTAQQRLFDAVLHPHVRSPILISGDVHMTQLMRKDCFNGRQQRSLLEMTTSGMTHTWGTASSPPLGMTRVPSLLERLHVFASASLLNVLHRFCPWTDVMISHPQHTELGGAEEGSVQGLQYSLEKNFGELEFDWTHRTVTMRTIGEDAQPLLSAKVSMDSLNDGFMPGNTLDTHDFAVSNNTLPEWTCVNYRGDHSLISHAVGHLTSAFVLLVTLPSPIWLTAYVLLRWTGKSHKGRNLSS